MLRKTSTYWSTCALSAAAAVALATPVETWAQTKTYPAGTVQRPVSARPVPATGSQQPAPVLTAQAGESEVQKELRRLYEESGREMPEMPKQIQMQRPQPATAGAAQPAATSLPSAPVTNTSPGEAPGPVPGPPPATTGALPAQGGAAPAASAPKSGSKNPVVSFFRKIVPGGQSKPTTTPAPVATTRPAQPLPSQSLPANVATRPAAPSYAPYSGQQPRRLPNQDAVTTASPRPQTPVTPAPLPPSPAAPVAAAKPLPLVPAPAVTAPDVPQPAAVMTAAQPKPAAAATAQPEMQSPFAAVSDSRAKLEAEPEFAPPIVVPKEAESNTVSVTAPPLEVEAAPQEVVTVAAAPKATAEFPDPFPEMSEEEADDELDADLSTPFNDLKIEDELADKESPTPASETKTVSKTDALVEEEDPFASDPALPALAPPMPSDKPSIAATGNPAPALPDDLAAPGTTPAKDDPALTPPDRPIAKVLPVETPSATPAVAPALTPNEEPQLDVPAATPSLATPSSVPAAAPISHQPGSETDAKMQLIRERGGMKGLKGFCPVSLRDDRELKDAQSEISATYRGQKFHFATQEAKAKFEADASRYAPAAYGADVVILIRDKDVAEGSLDYAAWFKGRLYLFSSAQTHDVFVADPATYAAPAGLE